MNAHTKFPYARFTQNRSLDDADRIYHQRIADALEIHGRHHEAFVERSCPYCGSTRWTAMEPFHGTYGVARCAACASAFVNPVPTLEALSDYYNNCACNKMLDGLYRSRSQQSSDPVNDDRVRKGIGYLGDLGRPARILEIGCGSGSFLSKLRRAVETHADGVLVTEYCGIDIDQHAIRHGVDPAVRLIASSAEEFAAASTDRYDLVLHFELIEHLADPAGFMVSLGRLLAPGGLMFFTTPNAGGLEMMACGYNSYRLLAHGIFPPMHLNAFSTANLTHFALRTGFAIVDIETPGALDVDMVSVSRAHFDDELFDALADADDGDKGLIQQLVARCKASSHMHCTLRHSEGL